MELRQLRYFLAIAADGGFRRAALRIRVAQQALSTQIAHLESELGVQLFERLPRGVRLTTAGRELLTHAERIVHEVEAARETLRSLAHGDRGALRIGRSNPMYFGGIFGPAIHALREHAPGADVRVSEMPTLRQLDALRGGTIDVGLGAGVPGERATSFSAEPIAEQALTGMLLSNVHRLAAREWLTPDDVAAQPIAIAAGGTTPAILRYMLEELARTGVTPEHVELVDETGLLLERVEFDGFLMPAGPTYASVVPRNIVFRPVRGLRVPYMLTARWRRADANPLIPELLGALRAAKSAAVHAAMADADLAPM